MDYPLRPFQRDFIRRATRPGIRTAVLSMPRGNSKSWLAAHLITRMLTPGDALYRKDKEIVLCSASLEQARTPFRFVRDWLGDKDYDYQDSATRVGVKHRHSNTKLRVISSQGRTAFGMVNVPWAIFDEPGACEVKGGELLWHALRTSQGKANSELRILVLGTLAPNGTPGTWWHSLAHSESTPTRYVKLVQGDLKTWSKYPTIRKANPMISVSADFRKVLLEERDDALRDPALKAAFCAYRLNRGNVRNETAVLLTVQTFDEVCARPIAKPAGRPIVGVDLGQGRAFSCWVSLHRSGLTMAGGIAPGIPSLEDQEKRDRQPLGAYTGLENLRVDPGLRVPRAQTVWDDIRSRVGTPARVICDKFRYHELRDVIPPSVTLEARRPQYSYASEDIRALRRLALDGPLSIEASSRSLLAASLSVTHGRERFER